MLHAAQGPNPMEEISRVFMKIQGGGLVEISPEEAKEILDKYNYAKQRKVYSHHVSYLSSMMKRGQWTPGTQLAFCCCVNNLQLVNGQHRLQAVVESGKSQSFQILTILSSNQEDVDSHYRHFDVGVRKRSTAEILDTTDVSDKYGLQKQYQAATYRAVGFIRDGFTFVSYAELDQYHRTTDFRLDAAEEWWAVAREAQDILRPAGEVLRKKILTVGIFSVILATLKSQPMAARKFWGGIAENDGLREKDPRATLRTHLLLTNATSPDDRAKAAALCWNAFYHERQLEIIRYSAWKKISIAGTPWQ